MAGHQTLLMRLYNKLVSSVFTIMAQKPFVNMKSSKICFNVCITLCYSLLYVFSLLLSIALFNYMYRWKDSWTSMLSTVQLKNIRFQQRKIRRIFWTCSLKFRMCLHPLIIGKSLSSCYKNRLRMSGMILSLSFILWFI